MKIAILSPTRGRPSGLMRLYESVASTISGKHQIIFAYYIDDDDEALQGYKDLQFPEHPNISVVPFIGQRQIIARAFNLMAGQITSDYYMNGADDMVFSTPGWDEIFSQRIVCHPYGFYYFDDGIQHEGLATFALVSRQWIDLMGYFFPEHIRHNYIDTYIFDVARRAESLVYIPEVRLIHLHFTIDNKLYDKTYADAEQHWGVDAAAYNNSVGQRVVEGQRIKSAK